MSGQTPCPICNTLGFVSHENRHLSPMFNVYGLIRKSHPGGRVTWEGECRSCGGTGFKPEPPPRQLPWWDRMNPFGFALSSPPSKKEGEG
jgi:DnaJ-class molecular chaperone